MKNLVKLLGLATLLTLVSCGSKSTSVEALNECINNQDCQELAPVEPTIENDFEREDIETIEFRGETLTFNGTTTQGYRSFAKVDIPGTDEYGDATYRFLKVVLKDNGEAQIQDITRSYWSNYIFQGSYNAGTWSINIDELTVNGKTLNITLN